MKLWHLLSKEALDKKIRHAEKNNGELLVTNLKEKHDWTNGRIKKCLFCLKSLAGGIPLDRPDECVILITLKPDAKIFRMHVNNGMFIDYKMVKDFFNVIDARWDFDYPLTFTEVNILAPEAVKSWEFDKTRLGKLFSEEFRQLEEKILPKEDFFYPDLTYNEQIARAVIIADELGFDLEVDFSLKEAKRIDGEAMRRLGNLPGRHNWETVPNPLSRYGQGRRQAGGV